MLEHWVEPGDEGGENILNEHCFRPKQPCHDFLFKQAGRERPTSWSRHWPNRRWRRQNDPQKLEEQVARLVPPRILQVSSSLLNCCWILYNLNWSSLFTLYHADMGSRSQLDIRWKSRAWLLWARCLRWDSLCCICGINQVWKLFYKGEEVDQFLKDSAQDLWRTGWTRTR